MPQIATHVDYAARGYENPYATTAILDTRLAAAERFLKAPERLPNLAELIADETLDAELVKDVICGMVARSAPNDLAGFETFQEGAGPFQASGKVANPHGDLYLTSQERKSLGIGRPKAFSIDLLAGRDEA